MMFMDRWQELWPRSAQDDILFFILLRMNIVWWARLAPWAVSIGEPATARKALRAWLYSTG
jgi:hypothetical protein